jgi:hypothetical protein
MLPTPAIFVAGPDSAMLVADTRSAADQEVARDDH